MDKFVKITKTAPSGRILSEKEKKKLRFNPYRAKGADAERARQDWIAIGREQRILAGVGKGQDNEVEEPSPAKQNAAAMKHVMSTLKHPGNPLTSRAGLSEVGEPLASIDGLTGAHCYLRRIFQITSGHALQDINKVMQGEEIRHILNGETQKWMHREIQPFLPFSGDVGYIATACSYCANTTDLELKQLVKEYGGVVATSESGATHILTSMSLSASKIQKFLTAKSKVRTHVIKPEWLFDSIKLGKRKAEWGYTVIKESNQGSLNFSKEAPTST